MERHQGAQHAGATGGLFLSDSNGALFHHLLGAHASVAPRSDLYEGAAGNRPAHHCHGIAQTSGIRTRSLDTTDRNGELSGYTKRSKTDDDRSPDWPHIVR